MDDTRRSFRLVCSEAESSMVEALLQAQGFRFEPEPFHALARVLTHEPTPLGLSIASHFGRIYIQDRSSMLPPLALNPPCGATVLDMCAAPGSKTGLLARLVGRSGFVLACEPSPGRIGTLRANLRRTGAVQSATIQAASERLTLADGCLSHILLDPPCSGWGTEDKNPNVRSLWTDEKVAPLKALQRKLLERASAMLAPGGRLVYSTCTTNVEEDEAQVLWAARELGLELLPLEPVPGFVFESPALPDAEGVLRVAEASDGQGFFVAALSKPGRAACQPFTGGGIEALGKPLRLDRLDASEAVHWRGLPPGTVHDFSGKAVFVHEQARRLIPEGLRWQGALIGKLNKHFFKPDAHCRALLPPEPGAGALDVQQPEDLLGLISGRALAAPAGTGHVPLYFRGLPLGWLARKGNRAVWSEKPL
ncbi:MAG: RsmB/NOP family class I SAM-dependent RNA methyltransferase [Desulfovibrionaceae bacterium]